MRKSKMCFITLSFLFLLLGSDCTEKQTTEPEGNPEPSSCPVPLTVGNWWKYGVENAPTHFTEIEIDSIIQIDGSDGFAVTLTVTSTISGSYNIQLGWVWDAPYFKEYLKDSTAWNEIRAFKYPSNVNETCTWGFYETTLVDNAYIFSMGTYHFNGCRRYRALNTITQIAYFDVIESTVGFLEYSVAGWLQEHRLNAKVVSFLPDVQESPVLLDSCLIEDEYQLLDKESVRRKSRKRS